jgi:hypothetical protein
MRYPSLWLWAIVAGAGCVSANVVIVDKKTALEEQAAGSFRGLEEEAEQAGVLPRPTPVTAAQLSAAGVTVVPDDTAAQGLPDALRADTLLVQRCIGEAGDGTLVLTADRCTGAIDVPDVNRLLERLNRARRQLWDWMAARAPRRSPDEIRKTWRDVHLSGLICGGQIEREGGGGWETKKC